MKLKHNLLPLLNKHFGYSQFRENQHEIINSILENNNTVVISLLVVESLFAISSLQLHRKELLL